MKLTLSPPLSTHEPESDADRWKDRVGHPYNRQRMRCLRSRRLHEEAKDGGSVQDGERSHAQPVVVTRRRRRSILELPDPTSHD